RCLQICQAFLVPSQSVVAVVGNAVDGDGTPATATQQYTVAPNQPPVAVIQPVSDLVVGKVAQLTGTVTDDESPLHWAEFRVNGAVVGTRVNNPPSGASIQAVFAPTTAGTATIELFAEDKFGVVGSASVQAPVAPSDPTGVTDVISETDFRWDNTDLVVTGK